MNLGAPSMLDLACEISIWMLCVGLLLSFVRLLKGPSLPDRIVALDLMSMLAMGLIAVHTLHTGHAVYLDVAIVLGLISFIGTISFARYIALRGRQ